MILICTRTTVSDTLKPILTCPMSPGRKHQSSTVHYLHGALHLFDNSTEIIKYTWSKTDKAIVDQIRAALDEDKYPLFVAEGSSESKVERILHNAYLHKALGSFESCCSPANNAIRNFRTFFGGA